MEPRQTDVAPLARDHVEFLLDLSVALQRHAMYPGDHPSIGPALEAVARRAELLLRDRTALSIGVARHRLLVDEASTDPDHPVLRRLADALHRHQIGAVSILPGLGAEEVGELLRELSSDPDTDQPLGLKTDVLGRWPHLKVHAVAFDALALAEDASAAGAPPLARSRAADLWAALARTALVSPDQDVAEAQLAPAEIARAVNRHPTSAVFDREFLGHLIHVARELASGPVGRNVELTEQTSELIAALPRDGLQRVLNSADPEQRAGLMYAATNGMAVDAVLDIVKAAAGTDTQTVSNGLLRMLTKLATYAQNGPELGRQRADHEFRDQVADLLEDWHLKDPNPGGYTQVLEQFSTSKARTSPSTPVLAPDSPPTALRVVQMSLEAGVFEPLTKQALEQILSTGDVSSLFDLLVSPPPGSRVVAERVLSMLTSPDALALIVGQEEVNMSGLEVLLPRLPLESYGPLLDAVGSSPNRSVRRRLLDLLSETPADIGPLIAARLEDGRWFVQRNMLMLLMRPGRIPSGFSAAPWTKHRDVRVRSEALRLQLMLPNERTAALRAALSDVSPRCVHIGLAAAQEECPSELISWVAQIALDASLDEEIRTMAVNTLGRLEDESALNALLDMADGGRSWFGRQRLPPKTPVLMAVIRALAERWAGDARSASVLALAGRSSDPDLRRASLVEQG